MIISKWEVVLGAPDKVNIPCLMHDTPSVNKMLKQQDLNGTNKNMITKSVMM